mmetsp:Transcript_27688/g.55706  ORF Transcript_27688/g.55706 Transcript_27688/m.55706 type:complete len:95 (+) Transcript_27688:412-696(+)
MPAAGAAAAARWPPAAACFATTTGYTIGPYAAPSQGVTLPQSNGRVFKKSGMRLVERHAGSWLGNGRDSESDVHSAGRFSGLSGEKKKEEGQGE